MERRATVVGIGLTIRNEPPPAWTVAGALNRSVEGGGFRVDLRVATLPPDAVADIPIAVSRETLWRRDERHSEPARDLHPPGVVHRDCFDVAGGPFLSVSALDGLPTTVSRLSLLRGAAEVAIRGRLGLSLASASGNDLAVEGVICEQV